MDVMMRVFVRVGVLVGVGVHHAVRVPVLVGVDVRVDVGVRVVVLDLICHHTFLLKSGLEMTRSDGSRAWRQSRLARPPGAPQLILCGGARKTIGPVASRRKPIQARA
jgi:hypothetical protein